MGRGKIALLVLAAVVSPLAYCGWAVYDVVADVSRAHAFSSSLIERVAAQGTGAPMPPEAPGSRTRPEALGQTLETVRRLGPLRGVETWSCSSQPPEARSYTCNGVAYSCEFQGRLDKSAFLARVSSCRDRASGEWQLGGMEWWFPHSPPEATMHRT